VTSLVKVYDRQVPGMLADMNERLASKPHDLADMKRDMSFRATAARGMTALALISSQPQASAAELVGLAGYALAQCHDSARDPDDQAGSLPPLMTVDGLMARWRKLLGTMLEGAQETRPPIVESIEDIMVGTRPSRLRPCRGPQPRARPHPG
jgi:hypothetical protein